MRKDSIDITGKKFNRLVAIKHVGYDKSGNQLWNFKCDCGKEKNIIKQNVTRNNIKSCGCLKTEWYNISRNEENRKRRTIRRIFHEYNRRAKRKNLEFKLTKSDFEILIFQSCHYCGEKDINHDSRQNYSYNGLDRIDNEKGYIIENVIVCCKYCNQMKSDQTLEEFKNRINKLYKYLNEEKI